MNLFIDYSWNYKETVIHLQALKSQYEEILASFSLWELKEHNDFIRHARSQIYSLPILEWQKDRIWNCLNGNDDINKVIYSVFRSK